MVRIDIAFGDIHRNDNPDNGRDIFADVERKIFSNSFSDIFSLDISFNDSFVASSKRNAKSRTKNALPE